MTPLPAVLLALPVRADAFDAARRAGLRVPADYVTDGDTLVLEAAVEDAPLLGRMLKGAPPAGGGHRVALFEQETAPGLVEVTPGAVDAPGRESRRGRLRAALVGPGGAPYGTVSALGARLVWELLGGWDRATARPGSHAVLFWRGGAPVAAVMRAKAPGEPQFPADAPAPEAPGKGSVDPARLGAPAGAEVRYDLAGSTGPSPFRARAWAGPSGLRVESSDFALRGVHHFSEEGPWAEVAASVRARTDWPARVASAEPVAVRPLGADPLPWSAALGALAGDDPVEVRLARDPFGALTTLVRGADGAWLVEAPGSALWPLGAWLELAARWFGGEPPALEFRRVRGALDDPSYERAERGSGPARAARGRPSTPAFGPPAAGFRLVTGRGGAGPVRLRAASAAEIALRFAPGTVLTLAAAGAADLGALEVVAPGGVPDVIWHPEGPPDAAPWSTAREAAPPRSWAEFQAGPLRGRPPRAPLYAAPVVRLAPRDGAGALPVLAPPAWRVAGGPGAWRVASAAGPLPGRHPSAARARALAARAELARLLAGGSR